MRFHGAVAAAVLLAAITVSVGASAFETTSIGGTNADGSAKYQDPDETGGVPMPSTSSPFGNFNFQAGTSANSTGADRSTNWLNGPGSSLGFTGSGSSSTEAASPFNTPLLRERN
jgi:hypothetical protein